MSLTTFDINGNTYSSYATVDEADILLAIDITRATIWANFSNEDKERHLIAATRRLDLLNWKGTKTTGPSQELDWPRSGITYPDGSPVDSQAIPKEIEDATCYLAASIGIDNTHANPQSSSNVKMKKLDGAEIEYFSHQVANPYTDTSMIQDQTVHNIIKIFLRTNRSTRVQSLNTDSPSLLEDLDRLVGYN